MLETRRAPSVSFGFRRLSRFLKKCDDLVGGQDSKNDSKRVGRKLQNRDAHDSGKLQSHHDGDEMHALQDGTPQHLCVGEKESESNKARRGFETRHRTKDPS